MYMKKCFGLEVTYISCSFDCENIFKKFLVCDILYFILCVAQGHGAKGQNEYEFSLEFLLPVKPEVGIRFQISPKYLLFLSYLGRLVLVAVLIKLACVSRCATSPRSGR